MALGNRNSVGARLTLPTGVEVASYAKYLDAQRAVDHLSDHKFPVEQVTIVGTDLRMVEKIIGRLTYGRVAGGGAMSGAWFGLLIGLVLWMFSPRESFMVLAGMVMGAAFGIMFAVVQFALRSRDRDFASTSQVVASRYAIVADPSVAGSVRRELESAGLGGNVGASGGAGASAPEQARRAPYGGGPGPVAGARRDDAPGREPGRPEGDRPDGAVPGDAGSGEPASTEYGSRPDEQPRYGIRLAPGQSLEDALAPEASRAAEGARGADGAAGPGPQSGTGDGAGAAEGAVRPAPAGGWARPAGAEHEGGQDRSDGAAEPWTEARR